MRKKLSWGIYIVLIIFWADAIAQNPDSTLILSDLIKEALDTNPQVQASFNAWQAEREKISQSGALPDPTLSFNLLNLPVNTFDFNQEPMTGKQVAIMQMFPFPGKLGLKEDIAREMADISEAKYQELQNQLIKSVKFTYFDLFFIDKSIETTRKNIGILQEFVRIAESRYTVGKGIQQDVLRAQVELSKMSEKLITLLQKREVLEARLNTLLNRPAESPVGKTIEPTIISVSWEFSHLKDLARQNRPLLKAWQTMVRQSEQMVHLAKKGYLPDFRVGVAYTQREVLRNGGRGVDFFSGLFSMNIPLYFWKKQNNKVQETRYSQQKVEQGYRHVQNQVDSDLDKILSSIDKNSRLLDLYKTGIIPQASQSLNSAIAGYQTDKVDFLTLLNNQISLFNFELDHYHFLSDYNKNIAELEAITGASVVKEE